MPWLSQEPREARHAILQGHLRLSVVMCCIKQTGSWWQDQEPRVPVPSSNHYTSYLPKTRVLAPSPSNPLDPRLLELDRPGAQLSLL